VSGAPRGGPQVHDSHVTFRFPDPDRELAGVKLLQELARPRLGPEFVYFANTDSWVLNLPRVDVARMEYKLHLWRPDGSSETICDPFNETRAPGPFGDKSVIEFPDYAAPAWTGEPPTHRGEIVETWIPARAVRGQLRTLIWTSPGHAADEALPLLVAHDGPEYGEYSGLIDLLDIMAEQERLPAMRAALIAPYDRNQTYSASASYARALTHEVLPALTRLAPIPHGRSMRIGMGASLGALAMLHAHRSNPASFGGLFLQSGSFFRQRYDKQESGFPRFGRISRFVGRVLTSRDWAYPIPVTVTCGSAEENLQNNHAVGHALTEQGYELAFHENRDAHNWIGWRDTFDPHLIDLLTKLWA
jgi:enterochelin esterase-like enzyme